MVDEVQSVATQEVPVQSTDATPSVPSGEVQPTSRTYTEAELQDHVRRATSTTQRDLARTTQEHQRALAQLQAMQTGQTLPPEQMIFMQGRNAALQEYQMRSQVSELAKKAGLEVDPYSPEVDEMLGKNPVDGYTKLATKLTESLEKRKRELEKEYKDKLAQAEKDAHAKWGQSTDAKVPSMSGSSSSVDVMSMTSEQFKEYKQKIIDENKRKR